MNFNIDKDAFSSGQIQSKLWLCEELENLFTDIDTVWLYGGWYGITSFLLKSRNNIKIKKIRSFDIDPNCEKIADMINENWVIDKWAFKAHTENCNDLKINDYEPDLIINTSTEHFNEDTWFINIPKGITVALQSNNMLHDDHCSNTDSLETFISKYPLSNIYYQGQLDINYDTWGFSRFMVIGKK